MAKQSDCNGVEQSRPLDEKNGTLPQKEDGQNLIMDYSDTPKREQWASKVDFILSCVGFAVGLGNVWRFPYLCYKNGGGAFLVPYFISLVCGGAPVFFLEIGLGQFMAQGGVKCWQICPIFQGIGIATTVIVFLLNIYYIIILAWDVAYCMHAFNWVLPWSHCDNPWNTERCTVAFNKVKEARDLCANSTLDANLTSLASGELSSASLLNVTNITSCLNVTTAANFTPVDPVVEFWEYRVLQISGGIDEPDGVVWELAVALLFVWIAVYFCVWKGIKWTGKVVYFTATFPYVVLTILLIRGVTLDGATDGIIYYLRPDFSKLGEAQVWIDAGTQIFFSYAIALGAMTALGSYNKFNNNFFRDCQIIAVINSATSLYAGFVIFAVLGFMAKEQGVDIDQVAESGPGLAFIAYPKAVTQMPLAPVWAVLFFVMILLIGLDSQFVGVESFITVMVDQFPTLRRGWNREIFIAGYCIVSFLLGLTMVTKGGMYVFQLFDYYSASGMALLWVCFFECIAISWIYGVSRFYDNLEMMLGFRAGRWMMFCWCILTPAVTVGIFIFMWVKFTPLTYNRTYEYPWWAQGLGMSMAFSSMICIPGYGIYKMLSTPGTLRQRWKRVTTPILKPHQIPESWTEWERHQLLQKQKNLSMGAQNGVSNGVHLNGIVVMPDGNEKLKDMAFN